MSSASEQIAAKANPTLAAELIKILPNILQPDNETIEKATEDFRNLSKHEAFLPTLTSIMISNDNNITVGTKQLAAVLFRRRILKKWKAFPEDDQKLVRLACIEYLSIADNIMYKSWAEIVAGLSNYELEKDGWPDLMSVLDSSSANSNSYETRLKGTELLKCVCIAATDPLVSNLNSLIKLFTNLLQSDDVSAGDLTKGQSVHKNIIDAIGAVYPYMEEEHVSAARESLPFIVSTIDKLLHWDESLGVDALSLISELCEIEMSNFISIEIAKDMVEICLKVAINENFEEETRASALSQIQMIIKYKKKAFTRYNLVEPLCSEMQKLIVNDQDPDDGIMSGGDGDRTVYTGSLQVIDQLAMYIPAEQIINCTAKPISELLKSDQWNAQRAGLLILSVIVEGCSDLILANYMEDLVPAVCNHLSNNEGKVRSAAYFALGQFAEHLQPDIADYSDIVMPQLMKVLLAGTSSPEFSNRDVITKIYYALETFVESLSSKPQGIDKYLDTLMKNLIESLQNAEGLKTYVLECIVGSIGAVAAAADEKFAPYLDASVIILQNFFPSKEALESYDKALEDADVSGNDPPEDKTILWGRAIATLSSICRAVGAQNYEKFAQTTLDMAITLSSYSDDPDIKSSAFTLFGALSSIMKEKISTDIQSIVDILFGALDEQVLDFGNESNDKIKAMANILELSQDLADGEDTDDAVDTSLSPEDLNNLNFDTSQIEAKVSAMETLGEIAEMAPIAFGKYMNDAFSHALRIAQYEGSLHDEILRSSLTSCLIMSSQLYKFGQLTNSQEAKEESIKMIEDVWPLALTTITDTSERAISMSIMYHLEKSIQIVGTEVFTNVEILNAVMQAILQVLSDKAACQGADHDLAPGEDQDQAEHDQLLIEYACDILPSTCNALGGENFKSIFKEFYPIMKKRACNKKAGTTRAAVLGAIADIMKASGSDLANEYGNDLIETYTSCLNSKENNVRNNAIYGLGMIISLGINSCSGHYDTVLGYFWQILSTEKSEAVRDQVLGAVGRMVIAIRTNENVNIPKKDVDKMVEGLLMALPVKADPSELAPVLLCLENYTDMMGDENVLKVVKNAASISENYKKCLEDETKIAISRLMNKVKNENVTVLSKLNEQEQSAIEMACNMGSSC